MRRLVVPDPRVIGPAPPDPAVLLDQWFAASPLGLALVDPHLRFARVNPALARLDGLAAAEHPGRTVREVLGAAAAAALGPLIARALAGETGLEAELEVPGRGVWHVTLFGVREGEQPVPAVAMTVLDVGEQRRAEAGLQAIEQRLELVLDRTRTGFWEWAIGRDQVRWSPGLGPLHGLARGDSPGDYESYLQLVHPDDREALAADVQAAATEGRGYEREFRAVWPDGTVRWLMARAEVLRGPDGLPHALIGLVNDIHDRKRRELAAGYLAKSSALLAESLDEVEIVERVAQLAVGDLADWVAVHMEVDGRIEPVAMAHREPGQLELAWRLYRHRPTDPNAAAGTGAVIRTGQTELYSDITDEMWERTAAGDDEYLAMLSALGPRSGMVVPISARGRSLGALVLMHGTRRSYEEPDLVIAEELGRRAGTAIDNARLHRGLEDSNARLHALQGLMDASLNSLDLDELLDTLLERLTAFTGADAASVLLLEEDGRVLALRASRGVTVSAEGRVPVGAGLSGRAILDHGSRLVADAAEHPFHANELAPGMRSAALAPLILGNRALGCLTLASRKPGHFADDHLETLEMVAGRTARAVSNAQLYEQTRATAVTLQRSLLPARLPDVPGLDLAACYLPASAGAEIGGDWYDVISLPDGRTAVVVGDVMGRGVVAAAQMGTLRTALRAYAMESLGPAETLSRLDRLVDTWEEGTFATAVVAFLDLERDRLVVSGAGHLPPLLVLGGTATAVGCPGVPLGAPRGERVEVELELLPGAGLLLYTDGLVERRTQPLDDRLDALAERAAAAPPTAQDLVEASLALLEEGNEDDVAVLAIRRQEVTAPEPAVRFERVWPAHAGAPAEARAELTVFAEAVGASAATVANLQIALTEAVSNVVVHAYGGTDRGDVRVRASVRDATLIVTVADRGPGVRPRVDSPGLGIGMALMMHASDSLEVRPRTDGPGTELRMTFRLR